MPDTLGWFAAIAGVSALVLVGLVRQAALRHDVLDHPSERSSHTVPTPRGGGLGLMLAVLVPWAWRAARPLSPEVLVCIGGATLVALVGWLDDRRGLAVGSRLAVHVVAAAAVGLIAGRNSQSWIVAIGLFAWWTFWTVSSINLVNFMDGINGLVASQIAVFAVSLALFPDSSSPVPLYAVALAGACLGFLPWNFPRARIFLGDVGSGGLGFLVPVLALMVLRDPGVDVVRAHLPLLPLYGDATWTILRRWRNGERLTEAHRSHLYQRLANGAMGHTAVTMIYLLAAAAGAVVAHLGSPSGAPAWIIGYALLVLLGGYLLHRWDVERARFLA